VSLARRSALFANQATGKQVKNQFIDHHRRVVVKRLVNDSPSNNRRNHKKNQYPEFSADTHPLSISPACYFFRNLLCDFAVFGKQVARFKILPFFNSKMPLSKGKTEG
jgi:hypothetical protein